MGSEALPVMCLWGDGALVLQFQEAVPFAHSPESA